MKRLFAILLVGIVAVLFGTSQCSEARVIQTNSYKIEYDETSLYVISSDSSSFAFNIMLRTDDGAWKAAHYQGIYGSNRNIKMQLDNGLWGIYDVWNTSYGAVYRSVWKQVYGYGFS